MPDFDAIATALAARFAGGVATPAAPAGLTDVREATANLPNELGPLPAVLVFTDHGELGRVGNQTRIGVATFRVRFYLALGVDLARDEVQLRQWATVLVDRLKVATTLSGTVTRAAVMSWQIGAMRFGGQEFSGIELVVAAVTSEPWAAS